jgi:PAS domain S-box-containing protein
MDLKIDTRLGSKPAAAAEAGLVRFDLFFKAFPRPIYIWQYHHSNFILVDYNDTGEVYLRDLTEVLLPHGAGESSLDAEGVIGDMKRCYLEKTRFKRELPGYQLLSTGEVKDLVITYAFVEPDFVMMSIKDVTDERAMLNKLQRLSNAVEQTADAVFITDRTGVIEYVNPAFEVVTGYPRVEVLGKTPRIMKSGEMSPGYYKKLWNTILNGKAFQGQTINHKRDGSKLIVEQTITPMKDQAGQITHFVSLLKDVTERIHFQEQEAEHRLAGRIQQGLFPKRPPKIKGYDIAGAVFPASNTSGDCYDFIPMLDDTTGIVVGDVCGHGMGSALIMASARAYLRSITRYVSDPRIVLGELNDQIYPDLVDVGFITVSLARLDPRRHTLEYANAGNWPAYILDSQGNVTREIRTGGSAIGLKAEFELRPSEPTRLEPGSMAVFMTDGIPEAMDASDQAFGIERMLSLIKANRTAPASEIIQRVRGEVVNFLGSVDHDDDQTLVICKRVA